MKKGMADEVIKWIIIIAVIAIVSYFILRVSGLWPGYLDKISDIWSP